jgi:transcriptional regulator with XRE-family HTH domain
MSRRLSVAPENLQESRRNNKMSTKTVAELLDELFKMHLHPSGREYTYQEVAKGVGGELDPTYIAKLRKGKIPNPGRNAVMLLCRFFKVRPSYFFPELQPPHDPYASQEEDSLSVALRLSRIQPHVKKKIEELLRALEQPEEGDGGSD